VDALLGLLDFFHAILASVTGIGAALAFGGVAFATFALGAGGREDTPLERHVRRSARVVALGAALFAFGALAHLGLTVLAVRGVSSEWLAALFEASFFRAYLSLIAAGAICAVAAGALARGAEPATSRRRARLAASLGAFGIAVGGAFTSHAAGRLGDRTLLLVLDALHRAAAYAWLGGVAHLVLFGAARPNPVELKSVLPRAARLFATCVGVLVAAGAALAVPYLGRPESIAGSSYGLLVAAKLVLLGGLLGIAAANHRSVARIARGEGSADLSLWRFAELEVGLGLAALFVAGTLASTPPGADIGAQLAKASEVGHVFVQGWRDLLQQGWRALDMERVGVSIFNHRLSGSLLTVMSLLAIAERASRAGSTGSHARWARRVALWARGVALWARNWPLLLLALGVFVIVHSERQAWPFGCIGFVASFTDPEIVQHRLAGLLVVGFAFFEWAVRTERLRPSRAGLVFPVICLLGSGLLVMHSHAGVGVKDEFLLQVTHLPIAMLGVAAGVSRWLELRLPGPAGRRIGWLWPFALLGIGMILLGYWEPPRAVPDPRDAFLAPVLLASRWSYGRGAHSGCAAYIARVRSSVESTMQRERMYAARSASS
jgi:putative copper resistance protein D